MDRIVRSTFNRNIQVHCGTSLPNVTIDWFFGNGSKIGIADRNIREGHYPNGTTILQIAAFRRVGLCDGGVYTCVATTANNKVARRNFTLIIGSELLLTAYYTINTRFTIQRTLKIITLVSTCP